MSAKAAFPVLWDALKLWWEDWSNQMLVALIALLLSLSVVLYPAAIFGVYEQALDLTHGVRTGIVGFWKGFKGHLRQSLPWGCLLYTSDAADDLLCVDLGGRRNIKKKINTVTYSDRSSDIVRQPIFHQLHLSFKSFLTIVDMFVKATTVAIYHLLIL